MTSPDAPPVLFDFEARSRADLKRVGKAAASRTPEAFKAVLLAMARSVRP
jgi:hypothetical protein